MVSTAAVGFTDGAYREYTKGVFADQDCFIRVQGPGPRHRPTATTRFRSRFTPSTRSRRRKATTRPTDRPSQAASRARRRRRRRDRTGVDLERRPSTPSATPITVTLTETEPHSGIFAGTIVPHVVADAAQLRTTARTLLGHERRRPGHRISRRSPRRPAEPRTVKYKAQLLMGQIQDVKVEHRVVDSLDLKARKNLIEAKHLPEARRIFKEVGLIQQGQREGQRRARPRGRSDQHQPQASLDRSLVEEAFSVKWDLLLVQDKLDEAISVCRSLTQLFPDSSLVDKALLKIGQAKMESEQSRRSHRHLQRRDQPAQERAEGRGAVRHRAGAGEDGDRARPSARSKPPVLSRRCWRTRSVPSRIPTSPFAGEALDKIANYYISTKDYARAVELMEQVFQDYPDASFLDKMLLKWVIASYRMGNYRGGQAEGRAVAVGISRTASRPKRPGRSWKSSTRS